MTEEQSERVLLVSRGVFCSPVVLADTSYFRDWRPSPEGFSLMPSALAWGRGAVEVMPLGTVLRQS